MARKPVPPATPEDDALTASANAEFEMEQIGVGGIAAKRLGIIATSAPLKSGTLAGDIRDTLLDLFKTRPKPWDAMTEAEQSDIGRALEYAARELVKNVVDTIRSDGVEAPVKAILESITDKGDIKITCKVKTVDEEGAADAILALHRARGKLVIITAASAEDYLGERQAFAAAADQPGLEFEAGSDDEPDFAEVD